MTEQLLGYCPICDRTTSFSVLGTWYRDQLVCTTCPNGSIPRERAAATALKQYAPKWKSARVLECSPVDRGISSVLSRRAKRYTAINFFPDKPLSSVVHGIRNENLESLNFADGAFDIFVALDVLEHVPDPAKAIREIRRVLGSRGIAVLTFPIRKGQVDAVIKRAEVNPDGTVSHLAEPEYHGNPFDPNGSLVYTDFGYDVHQWISELVDEPVHVTRYSDAYTGILGEFTDVTIVGPGLRATK